MYADRIARATSLAMAPLSNQLTFVAVVIFAAGFGLLYDSNKDTGDVSTQYCGQEPVELLQALERQVPPPNPVLISLGYNVCIDRELA